MEEKNIKQKKELAEGTVYLSVVLKAMPLNIQNGKLVLAFFPNEHKTKENQPDYVNEFGGIWKRKKQAKKLQSINSERW